MTSILLCGPRVGGLLPFFEQRGYAARATAKGSDGLATLAEENVAVVVFELDIEDIDGPSFLAQCKSASPTTDVILVDRPDRQDDILPLLSLGMDAFVAAPPSEDDLFDHVAQICQRRAARAERDETQRASQEALQQEVEELRGKTRRLSDLVDERDGEIAFLKNLADDLDERNRRLAMLEVEHEALQNRIDDEDLAGALRTAEEQVHSLQQALRQAEDARIEKEGAWQELEGQTEALREQLATLTKQSDELQAVAAARQDDIERQQAQLERLQNELDDNAAQLRMQQTAMAEAAERAEQRNQELTTLRAETLALTERLSKTEDQLVEVRAALQAAREERERALADRSRFEDVALDMEINKDEYLARIAELEAEVEAQRQHFKKERLRLIEEKQDAATGSHEAFQKMEAMVVELRQLRAKLNG